MGGSYDWRMLHSGETSANKASGGRPDSKIPTAVPQQFSVTSKSGWTVHVAVPAGASATLRRAADLACMTIQTTVDQLGANNPGGVPDIDALLKSADLHDAVNRSAATTDYNASQDALTRAKARLAQHHETVAGNVHATGTDERELDKAIWNNAELLAQTFAAAGPGKPSSATESFLLADIVSTLQDVESEFEAMAYQNVATASSISLLNLNQLEAIMPGADPAVLEEYLPHLEAAMRGAGINTPAREAAFLAEVAAETDNLRTLTEYGDEAYIKYGDTSYFEKSYGPSSPVGHMLGNDTPGDGALFRGRGGLQLTGRRNYDAAGKALGKDALGKDIDLVSHPELAADPKYAFATAAWYWNSHHLNEPADAHNFTAISQIINGGSNGRAAREAAYARARTALGAE